MAKVHRPFPCRVLSKSQNNRSTAQFANGVGENPLNGNGVLLTDDAEDEDMVDARVKARGWFI